MEYVAAIVGRPNVGKSTLFNRLVGRQAAIVHPTSGVTRDRNYGEAEWTGKKFFLIDTGGYVPESQERFEKAIRQQVMLAIEEADLILFVVDAKGGIHPPIRSSQTSCEDQPTARKSSSLQTKLTPPKRNLICSSFTHSD